MAAAQSRRSHDIGDIADKLIDLQLERHAWLIRAGEQIRKWRAEDEANGIEWESTRDGGGDSNPPPVNHD